MKNSTVTISVLVVIIILLLVAVRGINQSNSSDDSFIKERIEEKYKSSGTIDCTGANSRTPECEYLLNLPID